MKLGKVTSYIIKCKTYYKKTMSIFNLICIRNFINWFILKWFWNLLCITNFKTLFISKLVFFNLFFNHKFYKYIISNFEVNSTTNFTIKLININLKYNKIQFDILAIILKINFNHQI